MAQPTKGEKAPQLYIGMFSGGILCAPKWRANKENPELLEATGQTYDVTQNALAVVVKYLEENEVTETDPKTGEKWRLRIVREPLNPSGETKGETGGAKQRPKRASFRAGRTRVTATQSGFRVTGAKSLGDLIDAVAETERRFQEARAAKGDDSAGGPA